MELPINLLKAAALFASKEQTRYYLNGVYSCVKNGKGHLIATDGKAMFCAEHDVPETLQVNADHNGAIIPLSLIEQLKPKKGYDYVTVRLIGEPSHPQSRVGLNYGATVIEAPSIDGTFPNYPLVVPRHDDGKSYTFEKANYDPDILIRFKKAAKVLGCGGVPYIAQNGQNPALVRIVSNDHSKDYKCFGVVMPMRAVDDLPDYQWILPNNSPKVEAA